MRLRIQEEIRSLNENDAGEGAIFYATGVFYYFKREDVQALFTKMAKRFPGAVLVHSKD